MGVIAVTNYFYYKKVAEENPQWISAALEKCMGEKLYSANAFRDVVDI